MTTGLAACAGAPAAVPTAPSAPAAAAPVAIATATATALSATATGTSEATMTVEPTIPAGAQALVAQAKRDVTGRVSVAVDQVSVVSVTATSWPDSSLGCPQPGFLYAQMVTPGYRIVLTAAGNSYEYHTDRGQRIVLCSKP